jgi:hypothetical protein
MAQNFTGSQTASTTQVSTQITTNIPNNFDAVRSWFSGATAPADTIAYMVWVDTSTGLIKQRDSANTLWNVLMPAASATTTAGHDRLSTFVGALAAKNVNFPAAKKGTVLKLVLVPDVTTVASSGSKYWRFQLRNVTQSLDLFAAATGTDTLELTANAAYVLTPTQNTNTNENDVLQLQITTAGAPTAVTDVRAAVDYYLRG